jgi:endonuclease G
MRKILFVTFIILTKLTFGQIDISTIDTIKTDIFEVMYSEQLEQPLWVRYRVQCPMGEQSRSGLDFYGVDSIHTSDVEDYKNNEWDRGHLAPAAAFNCDRETLKKTFTYLNCALQHEGLNRGPWRELEEFERGLAKIFDTVMVEIIVTFDEDCDTVAGGATIPSGFVKKIMFDNKEYVFYFPNKDVSGQDWGYFKRLY